MAKNNRCPLQEECEKKCTWQHHELDCPYYSVNARPDYYIEDQEEIRRKQEREALEKWETEITEDIEEDDDETNREIKQIIEKIEEQERETKKYLIERNNIKHLDGPHGVTEKIKQAMYEAARQFVYIGFLLWEVKQNHYYKEKGYENVYEYAEIELGFKKSSTKNFIGISETFGNKYYNSPYAKNAILPTMQLKPEYKDFNYSQLCEMLAMSPAKRETITPNMTIKQIREVKKQPEPDLPPNMETIPIPMPENKPIGQTSGQITVTLKLNKEQEKFIRYLLKEEIDITPVTDRDHRLAIELLNQMG